ncbi:MAG TPA: PD-(D/E)XK nuclease family protein [Acidimicrobiales bacterium]|nr:PD-(D/E)XK nuclease family protein [Acidimicrobiales bacterium]
MEEAKAIVGAPAAGEADPGAPRHNPAQAEVLAALGARPHERPAFDPRLRAELRAELEERLAPLADQLPRGTSLWVSKHLLSSVHGCEGMFVARDAEEFAWTPANARGVVAHKAIELAVSWRGDPAPGLLVDEALARLASGTDSIAGYLGALGEGERAELHGEATERVSMFQECFPRLEARWRPVPESRLRADLCNDRIVLSGKVDLTVGRAEGVRAGKVLIDLKTGGFAPTHVDDLRFYALVETLRLGVPPRLLASYYLDGGRLHDETVHEALLRAALERVVRGVEAAVDLRHNGRVPTLRPGPPCRWCPVQQGCGPGQRWLEQRDDEDGWTAVDED